MYGHVKNVCYISIAIVIEKFADLLDFLIVKDPNVSVIRRDGCLSKRNTYGKTGSIRTLEFRLYKVTEEQSLEHVPFLGVCAFNFQKHN